MPARNNPLKISLVGAGRVGTTLAVLFRKRGHTIVSVISRTRTNAKRCATLVHCSTYSTRLEDVSPATNLLIIATPDEAICEVAESVGRLDILDFSHLRAFHASGSLTSDELRSLARRGVLIFSMHPIQTFPKKLSVDLQVEEMAGVGYGIEGSPRAIGFAKKLVSELGGSYLIVPKKKKISYHLACVIASNYTVTLLGAVEEIVAPFAGSPRLRHFKALIETSVRNALQGSPQEVLTGPIVRGSVRIVKEHLRELRRNGRLDTLYRAVGLYALQMSRKARNITNEQERALRKILLKSK